MLFSSNIFFFLNLLFDFTFPLNHGAAVLGMTAYFSQGDFTFSLFILPQLDTLPSGSCSLLSQGRVRKLLLLFSSIQNTLLSENFKGTKVYLNLLCALGRHFP